MKLVSDIFPAKPDGTFSVDLPDGATIVEYECSLGLLRVVYELHDSHRESTPEWEK